MESNDGAGPSTSLAARGGASGVPARRGPPVGAGALGVVGAGLCGAALLHVAPFATLFVGGAALIAGIGLLAARYATRSPAAAAAREREAKDRDDQARRARFAAAKKLLYGVPAHARVRPLAAKALAQIDLIATLEDGCRTLLAKKFEAGEMTQVRYAQAIDAATSAVATSLDELAQRLATLAAGEKAGDAAGGDGALAAEKLVASNEQALGGLRAVHDALAAIRTSREGPSVEVERAVAVLGELAERAKLFDVRS